MIEIVPYKESWPSEYLVLGRAIRSVLGERALAIHHIGSTSVVGLAAKDVIDIQITSADLDESILRDLNDAGYIRCRALMDHCPPGMTLAEVELLKFFTNNPGRHSHMHVRVRGRFNQRYPLLCRDYLRTHPTAANAYCEIKRQLSRYFPNDVDAYYDIKDPVFDVIMTGANEWADQTGWSEPPTDA